MWTPGDSRKTKKKARIGSDAGFLSPHLQAMDFFLCCPRILPQFGYCANRKKKSAVLGSRGLNPFPCRKEETGQIIAQIVQIVSIRK
jgi:hypothetical protein